MRGETGGAETCATVAASEPYAALLKAAISRSGMSVRGIAKLLAERTGNDPEDERSALYRYTKKQVPGADRAAHLAAILNAPELAAVTRTRRDRLGELEAELAALREEHDSFVEGVTVRLAALEAAPAREVPRSGQRSKGRRLR